MLRKYNNELKKQIKPIADRFGSSLSSRLGYTSGIAFSGDPRPHYDTNPVKLDFTIDNKIFTFYGWTGINEEEFNETSIDALLNLYLAGGQVSIKNEGNQYTYHIEKKISVEPLIFKAYVKSQIHNALKYKKLGNQIMYYVEENGTSIIGDKNYFNSTNITDSFSKTHEYFLFPIIKEAVTILTYVYDGGEDSRVKISSV